MSDRSTPHKFARLQKLAIDPSKVNLSQRLPRRGTFKRKWRESPNRIIAVSRWKGD